MLLLVTRSFWNDMDKLVPVGNAWVKLKLPVTVFCRKLGTPVVTVLDNGLAECSMASKLVISGSYEPTAEPAPNVDCTSPDAPVPAPPAPPEVPPAPPPAAPAPIPPTPPPGVPESNPVATPSTEPPAWVRKISASAICRL